MGRPVEYTQFTSTAFTDILKREEIKISMDGRGRALDNIFVERLWRNVKYEDVYLKGYSNMAELTVGLAEYFAFYNSDRPHQGIGNKKPDDVYATRQGGGASIPDYFSDTPQEQTGQRCSAAVKEMDLA